MKHIKTLTAILFVIAFIFASNACSKGKSPVEPTIDAPDEQSLNIPSPDITVGSSRNVLSIYECTFDPNNKTFSIEPISRSGEYHFPLTNLYPNVLEITGINWTPDFWVDIKLTHPLPGSGIDAFDPRVIAILPEYDGKSMNYPIFDVHANNYMVIEPDGYTKLFDSVNPSIVGTANPFMSYFKDEPNRVWSSTGTTENTVRWHMNVTDIGGPFVYELIVDVSTNYPDPPQPVIDNALEPVRIEVEISEGLDETGGLATVTATLLDWQGEMDIKCKVESPDLFTGIVELAYLEQGPNPYEYIFTGEIINTLGVAPGNYDVLVAAWDYNVQNHVFTEINAHVEDSNAISFSPEVFNKLVFTESVWGYGEIAAYDTNFYVASRPNSHIFDMQDPYNPNQIGILDRYCSDIAFYGNYAYSGPNPLKVIDITSPSNPVIITEFPVGNHGLDSEIRSLTVHEGYLYVCTRWHYMWPSENVQEFIWVFEIDSSGLPEYVSSIIVGDGYFEFVANYTKMIGYKNTVCMISDGSRWNENGFNFFEVSDPAQPYFLGTISAQGSNVRDLAINNETAYLSTRNDLRVYDIENPSDVYQVSSLEASDICQLIIDNDILYTVNKENGVNEIKIIDVSQNANLHILNETELIGEWSFHEYSELEIFSNILVVESYWQDNYELVFVELWSL